MLDITLVDITPSFCPDCGAKFELLHDPAEWLLFRKFYAPFLCPCGMTIFFVKDLETVIRRINDEKESKEQSRRSS